jgi:hypothetical protein
MLARDVHYHRRENCSLIDDDLNRGHAESRIRDSVRHHISGGAREFVRLRKWGQQPHERRIEDTLRNQYSEPVNQQTG